MRHSRLSNLIIDCQTEDIDAAAHFWSAALGHRLEPADGAYPSYRALETPDGELKVLVQAVDHASRVHLDIETDDVEAEARRLETLGARRVRKVRTWWVMEAAIGQRFCVVRPQQPGLAEQGNRWDDGDAGGG